MEPIWSLDEPAEEPRRDPYRGRMFFLRIAAVVAFAVLSVQLFRLQIIQGYEFRGKAEENRFRQMVISPTRGVIYDRNDVQLVRNKPSYTVSIVPADLPREPKPVYQRLGRLLGLPPEEIANLVNPYPDGLRRTNDFTAVPIKKNVPRDIAFNVEERRLDVPGVHVAVTPVREYLDGPLTSHILGYAGPITAEQLKEEEEVHPEHQYQPTDQVGQAGLERVHESKLRGLPGERKMVVDVTGREVRPLEVIDPRSGYNLRLSIDLALQREITNIMTKYLDKYQEASAVAIDPRNGQVLALVSLPTYDNNLFSKGMSQGEFDALVKDARRPLVNHAISDVYPPGSTFKVIVAAAALQEKIVSRYTKVSCPGGLTIPGTSAYLRCWATHGVQDMVSALANSCDTYFWSLGGGPADGKFNGLGAERIAKYARAFGFGAPTGIDLPSEVDGIVPDPTWKRDTWSEAWYRGDTYNFAIGQGFMASTVMQLANAVVPIANGGTIFRPKLLLDVVDDTGKVVEPFKAEVVGKVPVNTEYLAVVREGMRAGMLVDRNTPEGTSYVGTSYGSDIPGANVAGKTGTAEFGEPGPDGDMPTHGWFVAFAPMESPKIVLAVFVRRGGGSSDAAERSEDILRYYFRQPPQPEPTPTPGPARR